ncbi:hypothetical protein [Rhodopseudomonas sp. WA056]|uniref:hypothetical protein n=1 Tax=Rhodopseudomonas sp. WA056 TaxID=2269367 RepID=UPI0013DFC10E|nr:hypothetical protein [Rhodopseudomonas sp. WA056]
MNISAEKKWKKFHARLVGTLVHLDEPQVVLLDHGFDAKIIGVAIDKYGYDYPFLGAEISFTQLQRYHREFVDLRYLFLMPKWKKWYIFDLGKMDAAGSIPLRIASQAEYTNEEHLPAAGFFARNHTHALDVDPIEASQKQTYLIDGSWSPTDLSTFFGKINDLYSFFLGLKKFTSPNATIEQQRKLIDAFTEHALRGGSSYVSFYTDLKNLLGIDERLAMGGIKKESPGYVTIEGRGEILEELIQAFTIYNKNLNEIRELYKDLHSYLSKMGLLKAGPDFYGISLASTEQIRRYSSKISELLEIDYELIELLTHQHPLLSAKILLSHCRRLEKYTLFFTEGRVKLPPKS